MLRTSCSDPGIIPRASLAEVEHMERSYGSSAATYRPPPRTKDIIVSKLQFPLIERLLQLNELNLITLHNNAKVSFLFIRWTNY